MGFMDGLFGHSQEKKEDNPAGTEENSSKLGVELQSSAGSESNAPSAESSPEVKSDASTDPSATTTAEVSISPTGSGVDSVTGQTSSEALDLSDAPSVISSSAETVGAEPQPTADNPAEVELSEETNQSVVTDAGKGSEATEQEDKVDNSSSGPDLVGSILPEADTTSENSKEIPVGITHIPEDNNEIGPDLADPKAPNGEGDAISGTVESSSVEGEIRQDDEVPDKAPAEDLDTVVENPIPTPDEVAPEITGSNKSPSAEELLKEWHQDQVEPEKSENIDVSTEGSGNEDDLLKKLKNDAEDEGREIDEAVSEAIKGDRADKGDLPAPSQAERGIDMDKTESTEGASEDLSKGVPDTPRPTEVGVPSKIHTLSGEIPVEEPQNSHKVDVDGESQNSDKADPEKPVAPNNEEGSKVEHTPHPSEEVAFPELRVVDEPDAKVDISNVGEVDSGEGATHVGGSDIHDSRAQYIVPDKDPESASGITSETSKSTEVASIAEQRQKLEIARKAIDEALQSLDKVA